MNSITCLSALFVVVCAAIAGCSQTRAPDDASAAGLHPDGGSSEADVARACVSKIPGYDSACASNVGQRQLPIQCWSCACTQCSDTCCAEVTCDDGARAGGCGSPSRRPWPYAVPTGGECDSPLDCASAICVQSAFGARCAARCTSACEEPGLTCQASSPIGGLVVFTCLPPHLSLCEPCSTDSDCVMVIGDTASAGRGLCLTLPTGRFCGLGCDENTPCPDGFTCTPGEDDTVAQCVPDSGVCSLP